MVIVPLINLIILLLVIGVIYWLVIALISAFPIPDPPARYIKLAAMVVAVLLAILVLLNFIGVDTGMDMPRVTT